MANYSPDFRASNGLGAMNMFFQRQYYDRQSTYLFSEIGNNPNVIDLWYETPFYGKVDRAGNLKVVHSSHLKYSAQANIALIDFVFDAFEDFRSYMNRARRKGKTSLSNELFGSFEPAQTYVDPFISFLQQTMALMLVYNASILQSTKIIASMEAYMNGFLKFFETRSQPLSFSAFFASSKVGITSTGFAIDLLDLDEGDDAKKNNIFKNSDFHFYVQGAANFGFRIDKNIPWRLIADLDSKRMQKYMVKYNIPDATRAFERSFTPIILYDAYTLLVLFNYGYEEYQRKRIYDYDTLHCFKAEERFKVAITSNVISKMKRVDIEKMSYPTFLSNFYNANFIKMMEKIKYIETQGQRLPNYNDFKRRFAFTLQTRPDRRELEAAQDALNLLADYYNPTKIYTARAPKTPHYLTPPKIIPATQKKLLTYKQTLATLYKTEVSLPGSVELGPHAYVKNEF